MKAQFYYPFLSVYELESAGIISDWCLIKGHKKTVQISGYKYPCSLVEATIKDHSLFIASTNQFTEHLELKYVETESSPQWITIPEVQMVKTLMRRLSRDKYCWVTQNSRFVQWNLSYMNTANGRLSIELFPRDLAIFFWKDERAAYIVTPYFYYNNAAEILRRGDVFAAECENRIKFGVFETQYFYLSLVYPSEQVVSFIGKYIRGDRDFIHKDFPKWGRFTNSDDPRIYLPEGEYPLRKIRV